MLPLRSRSIATLVALTARGSTVAVQAFGVPLAIGMAGTDAYSAFIVLSSITTWFSLANLGIPNAVLSPLASAIATGDTSRTQRIISSSIAILTTMACAMGLMTLLATLAIPAWHAFLGETLPLVELRRGVLVAGACACAALPASMGERIFLALQRPVAPQVVIVVGSLTTLVALVIVPGTSFPALCAAFLAPPIAVQLLGLVVALRSTSRPRLNDIDWGVLSTSLQAGRQFLLVQIAAIAMWQTDNLIVAHFFDAESVVAYSTAFRFAAIGSLILGSTMLGVWPAVAAALARRDVAKIGHEAARQSRTVTLLAAAAGTLVALFGDRIVQLWTLEQTQPVPGLMLGIGCYLPVLSFCYVQAQFLNGLGRVRGQMIYGITSAAANLLLSMALARPLGPAGVCWATVLASLPAAVFSHIELRTALKQEEE